MDDPNLEEPRLTLPERLQALLEMLFPEPPLVDILTLNSFTFGYRFSGLGPRAVADIERAQRVTRSSGDYSQMGLSEFYAGLIYLHEGQFLGAAQYFAEARRYWTFGGSATAVCLTHLAQGIAQQESYHYEPALSRYGQAERCLRRFPLGDTLGRDATFVAECRALLAECREELAARLKAQSEGDVTEREARRVTLPPASSAEQDSAPVELPTNQAATPDTRPPADLPIVRLRSQIPLLAPEVVAEETGEGQTTAVFLPTPIPGHQNTQPHLVWYKIELPEEVDPQTWLPGLPAHAHALVDTRISRLYRKGDWVIVNSERVDGQIPVRPDEPAHAPVQDPIFLGEVEKPPPDNQNGRFGPEDSGSVRLSPDTEAPLFVEDIIGIVIGVWADFTLRQRL